ncbi:GTP cyclohydrolase [Pantoea ananatis]|nr:GTP cyclohydrolase [Pantoea ananatis]
MKLKYIAEAALPTLWGEFTIIGFEEIANGHDHVALVLGNIRNSESVLTRIHSECLTGDVLSSLKCDCGFQLKAALEAIVAEGCGILLYHRQEGRNIGLLNKIRAYALQDRGYDTVEANMKLGFSADERDFSLCSDMLKILGINKIKLLTNNPEKIEAIRENGIEVTERVPLVVGRNNNNESYLITKATKMGHLLPRV